MVKPIVIVNPKDMIIEIQENVTFLNDEETLKLLFIIQDMLETHEYFRIKEKENES